MSHLNITILLHILSGRESSAVCAAVLKFKCCKEMQEWHPYLSFQSWQWMWGDSWTHAAVGPTCLHASFRLPSTDTEEVSTSVEQSFVHLSSSSSSLANLNPIHSGSHPASFRHPLLKLPFSFLLRASSCSSKSISAAVHLAPCLPRPPITPLGIYSGVKSKFLFWGWPWRMWVLPLAGDCGCLVWA